MFSLFFRMSARSRKSINSAADLDLSLTGSQISTLSSSRRPNSARGAASPSTGKRPNSASLVRGKSPVTAQNATVSYAQCSTYNVLAAVKLPVTCGQVVLFFPGQGSTLTVNCWPQANKKFSKTSFAPVEKRP